MKRTKQVPIRDCRARYGKTIDARLRDGFETFIEDASLSNKQLMLDMFMELESIFGVEDDLSLASAFETTIGGQAVDVVPRDELMALRKRVHELESRVREFAFIDEPRGKSGAPIKRQQQPSSAGPAWLA